MPTFEVKSAPPINAARAPALAPRSWRPAQAELQQQLPAPALADARGLGGDQRLVVELVEQRRLENLGHRQRPLHHGQRHVGVHHPALRGWRAGLMPAKSPFRRSQARKSSSNNALPRSGSRCPRR